MSTDTTTFTLVEEWADEGEWEWPYPNQYKKSLIEGTLADLIRAKFGVDAPVYITETEISGGWSEYTQETDFEFTVECGDESHEFSDILGYDNGLKGLLEWLGGAK